MVDTVEQRRIEHYSQAQPTTGDRMMDAQIIAALNQMNTDTMYVLEQAVGRMRWAVENSAESMDADIARVAALLSAPTQTGEG